MRFRKSIKIAPGVKLNLSKSGVSSTIGGKGLSVNMGKKGAYLNTGIPGTGISNRVKLDGKAQNETGNEQFREDNPLKPRTEAERKTERITARVLLIAGVVLLIVNPIIGGIVLFFGICLWLHTKIEKFVNGTTADDALAETSEAPQNDA